MTAKRWDIKKSLSQCPRTVRLAALTAAVFIIVLMAAVLRTAGLETEPLPGTPEPEAGWNSRSSGYRLLEGTGLEITVTTIKGEAEGAALYLVAGIHGDEKAGWKAAERLKEIKLDAGTLYILSPANRYGAGQDKRRTEEDRDINRNFPGDPDGCDAERIAAAVYEDIKEKAPALVLDLHEARPETGGRDALGNSLICQSLEETGDMILELLEESGKGMVASSPLTLYGSPPTGSINRVITEELKIPVITVETFREEELEQRIENHLEIVEFVLEFYGLLDSADFN